jgi:SAM-dependent methyltransferase
MLYHVPNMDRALSEIRRVLRAGGRLYATTVGLAHLQELDALLYQARPELRRTEALQFTLENGAAVLERWFAHVTLDRYPDSLVIPEREPLIAWGRAALLGDRLPAFVELVRHELADKGALHVTKDSGLFMAWNEP